MAAINQLFQNITTGKIKKKLLHPKYTENSGRIIHLGALNEA